MATWHQSKNPSAIQSAYTPDKKLWKVVNDSYNKMCSVMKFEKEEQAIEYAEKTDGFLIPPKRN